MHNERVLGDFALSSLLILQFSKEYFTAVEAEVFCGYITPGVEGPGQDNGIYFVELKIALDTIFLSHGVKPAVTTLKPRKLLEQG